MTFGQRVSHIIKQKTGPDDPELQDVLSEALDQVEPGDLVAVADELATRHEQFRQRWGNAGADRPPQEDEVRWLARSVTSTRRQGMALAEYLAAQDVAPLIRTLLHGKGPAEARVEAFVAHTEGLDRRLALELATGLLHFTFPNEHWLWTRWLWDVTTQTGILPLLAGSVHNLVAGTLAEGYVRVGSVTAMSMRFAEGTGLLTPALVGDPRRRAFAADAFLACAYSIYLYGITSWRLSREFNRLLPTLPNMMRRLLGLPKVGC